MCREAAKHEASLREAKGELAGKYLLEKCSHFLCEKQVKLYTESRRLLLLFCH